MTWTRGVHLQHPSRTWSCPRVLMNWSLGSKSLKSKVPKITKSTNSTKGTTMFFFQESSCFFPQKLPGFSAKRNKLNKCQDMWSTHFFSENESIRQPLKQHGGCKTFGFRCAATYLFICRSDRRWTWAHIQLQAEFLQIIGRLQVQSKVFKGFCCKDQGHKVNSTCENKFLSPLTSWLFLCGHLKLQSSSVNRSPYVSSSRAGRYRIGSAILWHSGKEIFKRRIVAVRPQL